jgi:hypothetical protein
MRLRIPELFNVRQMTAYAVARASNGRISLSTAYRLTRARGRFQRVSRGFLLALCEVLHVSPGELFEMKRGRRRSRGGKTKRR